MREPFTPEQEARLNEIVREALIVHSIGATIAGVIARRHYTLFYGEMDARRAELDAAAPSERDRLVLAIAAEAHEQELAEREAAERSRDPDNLSLAQRLVADLKARR